MHDCSAWRPDRSHRSQLLCQTPREWWWCPASTAHLDVQDLVFIRFFRLPNTEYWHGWGARLAVHCASPFCSSAHTGLCPAESAPTDVHRAALTLPDAGTQGREPGRRSQWQLPPRPFATRPAASPSSVRHSSSSLRALGDRQESAKRNCTTPRILRSM
jgi:hypothetical protein